MNYEMMYNNVATISGIVAEEPKYSHEMFGEGFYESKLIVPRLSDQVDIIPFTVSERLLKDGQIAHKRSVTLVGQMRSYNKIYDGKSKLLLTLFVREVLPADPTRNPNSIDVVGYICKPTVYRTTPFKREICDVLLAVNRAYNKSDYLPCIAWGRNAKFAKDAPVGTKIKINGRIQSREYVKTLEDGTDEMRVAYEISINRIDEAD